MARAVLSRKLRYQASFCDQWVLSELADRFPRLGALLLTLPVVSIVAFVAVWNKDQNMTTVSRLARETLVLVPLGLDASPRRCS